MGVAKKLHFLDSFADGSDQRYIWRLLNQPFPPRPPLLHAAWKTGIVVTILRDKTEAGETVNTS